MTWRGASRCIAAGAADARGSPLERALTAQHAQRIGQERLKERDWQLRESEMEVSRLGAELQLARGEVQWQQQQLTDKHAVHVNDGGLAVMEASLLQVLASTHTSQRTYFHCRAPALRLSHTRALL